MIKRCPFCAGELVANPNQEMFLEKNYVRCANKKCVSNGYPMTIEMLDEISLLKYRAEKAEWAVRAIDCASHNLQAAAAAIKSGQAGIKEYIKGVKNGI